MTKHVKTHQMMSRQFRGHLAEETDELTAHASRCDACSSFQRATRSESLRRINVDRSR